MSVDRRRFLGYGSAVAGLSAATIARGAVAQAAAVRPSVPALSWLIAGSAFGYLSDTTLAGNPTVCRNAFGGGSTWFIADYAGTNAIPSPIPSGYSGVGLLRFTAYQNGSTGLIDALSAGLPSWVTAVQYDSESWTRTPDLEQGAWIYNTHAKMSYAQEFCAAAHSHGLKVVLAPGNDLCNNSPNPAYPGRDPQYPITAHADQGQNYNAFVRHNLASAAQYLAPGDVFEYQAQELELDAATYQSVTTKVAAQVAAVSTGVTFLAGLGRSKLPSDGATCADLSAAATGVAGVASGFWLNVGHYTDQVRPMICTLKKLGY